MCEERGLLYVTTLAMYVFNVAGTGGSTTGGQQNERLTTLANTKTTGLSAGDTNIVCPSLKPAVVDLLVDERCSSCVK